MTIKVKVSDAQRSAIAILTLHKVLAESHFNRPTLRVLLGLGLVEEADADECSCGEVHLGTLYSLAPTVLDGTIQLDVG